MRTLGDGAACASNLRQLGAAVRGYVSDNNNTTFPDDDPLYPSDASGRWLSALRDTLQISYQPPLSSDIQGPLSKLFICPSDPSKGGWAGPSAPNGVARGSDVNVSGARLRSYTPNRLALNRRISEFSRPSQTIILTDFPWGKQGTRAIYPGPGSNWEKNYPTDWHNGTMNCLFLDGHVEAIPGKNMVWGKGNERYWYVDYPTSGNSDYK